MEGRGRGVEAREGEGEEGKGEGKGGEGRERKGGKGTGGEGDMVLRELSCIDGSNISVVSPVFIPKAKQSHGLELIIILQDELSNYADWKLHIKSHHLPGIINSE